jgi:hypothetical protein
MVSVEFILAVEWRRAFLFEIGGISLSAAIMLPTVVRLQNAHHYSME